MAYSELEKKARNGLQTKGKKKTMTTLEGSGREGIFGSCYICSQYMPFDHR
jgi:hypothetical protein